MAAHVIALYHPQADVARFDAHYESSHVPLAKKLPGLRRYTISNGAPTAPDGSQPFHLIADLEFDSLAAIGAALGSPEGAATVADVGTFTSGPVTIVMYEDREV